MRSGLDSAIFFIMAKGTVPTGPPIDPSLALRPQEGGGGDQGKPRIRIRRKYAWLAWLMVLISPLSFGLSALPGVGFAIVALLRRPKSKLAWSGLLAQSIGFVVMGYAFLIWGPVDPLPEPLDRWRYKLVIGGIWGDYQEPHLDNAYTDNPFFGDKEGELWYRSFDRNTFTREQIIRFAEASGLTVYRQGSISADQAQRIKDALSFRPTDNYEILREDLEQIERLRYPLTASAHRMLELIYRLGGDTEHIIFEPLEVSGDRRLETFVILRSDGRRMVIFSAIRHEEGLPALAEPTASGSS